jgi:hypothetical protein
MERGSERTSLIPRPHNGRGSPRQAYDRRLQRLTGKSLPHLPRNQRGMSVMDRVNLLRRSDDARDRSGRHSVLSMPPLTRSTTNETTTSTDYRSSSSSSGGWTTYGTFDCNVQRRPSFESVQVEDDWSFSGSDSGWSGDEDAGCYVQYGSGEWYDPDLEAGEGMSWCCGCGATRRWQLLWKSGIAEKCWLLWLITLWLICAGLALRCFLLSEDTHRV